jgi:hypothetical protein
MNFDHGGYPDGSSEGWGSFMEVPYTLIHMENFT